MSDFEPGIYAKGDQRKVVDNVRQAVALEFEGYRRLTSEDSQEQAADATPAPGVSETAATPDVSPTDTPAEANKQAPSAPKPKAPSAPKAPTTAPTN
jgi:hypothetical protein